MTNHAVHHDIGRDQPQIVTAGAGATNHDKTSSRRYRVKVVIVGAGASGLQCAKRLVDNYGISLDEVIILEARDRIGGRIHSTRERRRRLVGIDGQHEGEGEEVEFTYDQGAAWVHGTGYDWGLDPNDTAVTSVPTTNPMMELLQEATPCDRSVYDHHLRHIASGNPWMRPHFVLHARDEIALYVAGRKLENDDPRIHAALQYHFATMKAIGQYGKNMFEKGEGMKLVTSSLQDGIDMIQQDNLLQQQLLKSGHDQKEIRMISKFYLHLLECWYGAPATKLQLCEFDADKNENLNVDGDESAEGSTGRIDVCCDAEYNDKGDFYGPHCTLWHGMEAVLEPLLRGGIRDRIELEQEVTQIRWNKSARSVSVETANGMLVEADLCVVTIPAGCLKSSVSSDVKFFSPALSAEKIEAISYLNIGQYKKVFLTFEHIFWADRLPAFLGMIRSVQSHLPGIGNFLLMDNLWARNGIPCIEAILFGSAGEWSTHKNVEEIRDAVLDFIVDAMALDASIKNSCVDCHVTRWEEDPYSQGSYSYMGLGALIRHVEELKNPEWDDHLMFAGEATITESEGSVHAALASGLNAAKHVSSILTKEFMS